MFSQFISRTARATASSELRQFLTTTPKRRFSSQFYPQPQAQSAAPTSFKWAFNQQIGKFQPKTHQFRQQRRQFSTTATPKPESEAPIATPPADAAEAAAAAAADAAYAGKKRADAEVVAALKKKVSKRMWYFRLFTICWIPTYVYFAKKYYTDRVNLYLDSNAILREASEHGISHLYKDATENTWPTIMQATYRGKDDIEDKMEMQRLLFRHVMIGQRVNAALVQAKADLMAMSVRASEAKYKARIGHQNFFLDLLASVNDIQNKVAMHGTTTLISYNHNVKDDEGFLNKLNPLVIARSIDLDAAIRDAYLYPVLAKLAMRRVNAGLLFVNSILDDEWYSKYGDQLSSIDDFEKLFAWWEAEQGFKRHQFERQTNGGINIIPSIATDAVKEDVNRFLEQAKNGRPITFNSITMTPLEEKTLSMPDPNQVIDMSKFPPKSVWSQTPLNTTDVQGVQVPRSGWYYTPLPSLPTMPKSPETE